MPGNINTNKFPTIPQSIGIFNNQVVQTLLIAQALSLVAFGFDWYIQIAVFITATQAILFFFNAGKNIPIKYLVGLLYSINYLLTPVIMFNGLNEYVLPSYRVVGSPEDYFAYVIPAMLMLILGLNMYNSKDAILDVNKVFLIVKKFPKLPWYLIVMGLISDLIEPLVPSEISIFFACFSYFKYVGFMLSLFGEKRFNLLYFLLSYGVGIIGALLSSLFGDLLDMLLFLGIILAYRYKASNFTKLWGLAAIVSIIVFIQIIKFPLRERIGSGSTNINDITEAISAGNKENESKSLNDQIANVLARLDQGWVTSKCIQYKQEDGYEFQNGAHILVVIESSIFPRILVPNKLTVGDPQEFNKYSGHIVRPGTSIALGLLADGYIDFEYMGIFVCLIFGLIINLFVRIYSNLSRTYPLIIMFMAVGFAYAIKPDNDTQSALGPLLKLTFIIWLTFLYFGKQYNVVTDNVKENILN